MSGTLSLPTQIKVGGQALPDGVFMRTSRAWAIARADGTVEVGAVPPTPLARVPVVRVVAGLFSALGLALGRGLVRRDGAPARRADRRARARFLVVFVALAVAAWTVPPLAHARIGSLRSLVLANGVALLGSLLAMRLIAPASIWRYHGAEHKAVAAHERGVDLDDVGAVLACPRVHDRCGTNLAFLMMLLGAGLTPLPGVVQVPVFLGVLGSAAELVSLAASRRELRISGVLLAGGRFLQRTVTTSEPSAAEQAVGCRALQRCLAEHVRLESRLSPVG